MVNGLSGQQVTTDLSFSDTALRPLMDQPHPTHPHGTIHPDVRMEEVDKAPYSSSHGVLPPSSSEVFKGALRTARGARQHYPKFGHLESVSKLILPVGNVRPAPLLMRSP